MVAMDVDGAGAAIDLDVDEDAAAARAEEAAAAAAADAAAPTVPDQLQQLQRPIQRLPPDLVNRIAAGEIVQRPVSALKELLENSLDAGSTHINITLREGGFKLLQVQDDGCGIRPEDLPLLCERHATSKLRDFGGLSNLSSLGFRGEALASLSYVSHLTVTTAVEGAEHAMRASFRDGALLGAPQPVAGCRGTTLTVEDLFFNTPSRRRALGSPSDEHARCADLVARYAAHRAGVAFALRRAGAARPDVLTTGIVGGGRVGVAAAAASSRDNASAAAAAAAAGGGGGADGAPSSAAASSLLQQQQPSPPLARRASRLDAIRAVYGAPLAKCLLPFAFRVGGGAAQKEEGDDDDDNAAAADDDDAGAQEEHGDGGPAPSFEATGYVSAPDWPGRRAAFVLFVNGRSVEASALRRAAEGAHAAAAAGGGSAGGGGGGGGGGRRPFFCFVDLRLPPASVDANVHPTKREVAFLHRDAVAGALADAVDQALRRADRQGRAFVQQLLPGAGAPGGASGGGGGGRTRGRATAAEGTATPAATEANAAAMTMTTRRDRAGGDHNLVRVDARARTLDAFVAFRQSNNGSGGGGGGGGAPAPAAAAGGGGEGGEGEGAPQRPAAATAAAAMNKPVASILAAPARRRGAREANGTAPLFGTAAAAVGDEEEEDPLLLSAPALGLPTSSSLAAAAAAAAAASQNATTFRPRPNPPPSSRSPAVERLLARTVDARAHRGLEESLRSAAFVGMADRARALVQAGASLLLLDLRPLVRDLAFQQALRRVGAHSVARISVSGVVAPAAEKGEVEDEELLLPSVAELIELALLEEKAAAAGDCDDGEDASSSSAARISEAASLASRLLVLKREPLRRSFGVEVTPRGRLAALPELVDGLGWLPSQLPRLALALARDVDFPSSSGEERFLETAAAALASCVSLPGWSEEDDDEEEEEEEEDDEDEEEEGDEDEDKQEGKKKKKEQEEATTTTSSFLDRAPTRSLERCVAHVVLPAMRVHLRPSRARSSDGSAVELTRLQSLYKIFERC